MLVRNQKSKMVYDVKELKEYFDKRFNELKNSLDVNNNTLKNFKSVMKSDLQKLEDKICEFFCAGSICLFLASIYLFRDGLVALNKALSVV